MKSELTNDERAKYLEVALAAASLGRAVLLDYFGDLSDVRDKGKLGLVSEADLASEKVISEYLLKNCPEVGILAEEENFLKQSDSLADRYSDVDRLWVIDPLDGTTNYIHNFPVFCISIGLQIKGVVEVGVVDVPLLNRTYSAVRGGGAFCNAKKIQVTQEAQLKNCLMATGFKSADNIMFEKQINILKSFVGNCRGIRRVGSAAFDLCMVADGSFDFYFEESLQPWDVAAGLLLVKEAGGQVTDYEAKESSIFDNSIMASNGLVHDQSLSIINKL